MSKLVRPESPYVENVNQIKIAYPDTKENSKHYVLWSGGTDSTLLLYELLDAYGPENVIAISLIFPWLHKIKVKMEQRHRKLFIQYLKTVKGEKFANFKHMEFRIKHKMIQGEFHYPSYRGLAQAGAWLTIIPLFLEDNSYLYEGNNSDDDLNVQMEDYRKAAEGIMGLIGKDIELREPYMYMKKYQIIEKLINYDIYDYTWFCEMPTDDESMCFNCTPCRTHISALSYLQSYCHDPYVLAKVNKLASNTKEKIKQKEEEEKRKKLQLLQNKKKQNHLGCSQVVPIVTINRHHLFSFCCVHLLHELNNRRRSIR